MRTIVFAAVACSLAAGGYFLTASNAAAPTAASGSEVAAPAPGVPERLIAHEWGTFTSFSGSNGVPVGFSPNNNDLPEFVYVQANPFTKSGLLNAHGLISMETPVVYFYTDRAMKVSVKVDFPRGWITEWYPFAADAPSMLKNPISAGQKIRWDARLLPGENIAFPVNPHDDKNPYYHARATDAVPLQVEVPLPEDKRDPNLRGGSIVQREKLLFYRGVGTFPPPVIVQALGGGQVRVMNSASDKLVGVVLVHVRGGKVGFQPIGELTPGATTEATIPAMCGGYRAELAEHLVKDLIAAGLYEKEARAMVKTWDHAWFGEEGTRLLYLVPRSKTDEVLPIKIEPAPTELVRVLVGRHDFLTPEQESTADRELARLNAAEAEAQAAREALSQLGRFSNEARALAAKRLEGAAQK
jgi:hypothetical protein